tara:strand:+ start:428 stop:1708 length:1281 start_codon:yes stop_codon:yes gene_type:complete
LLTLAGACSCEDERTPLGDRTDDPGVDMGDPGMDAATADMMSEPSDFGAFDPFDPDAACGSASIPTERVPGSLMLVFDRSGSMNDEANGDSGPTKWDLATAAINSALGGVSDDLNLGLMLFPVGSSECTVDAATAVQVDVAPLGTTRAQIASALSSASAGGGNTPIASALRAGWGALDAIDGRGQKGLILVTDGAETCETSTAERDAVLALAADQHASNGYLTYAVGLDESNNFLSTLAFNGDTPRNATCLPECTTPTCYSDADCDGGNSCWKPVPDFGPIPIPGQCACGTDADCPDPLTCESLPFIGPQCSGTPNCCHYDAEGSSFQSDFQGALEEIATRFLDSCVFEVPRDGIDGFNPGQVNVGVTFEGEERQVLPRSTDPSMNSWNYTSSENDALVIQGPICDQLLMDSAEVEIVVGCPTILI